MNKNCIFTIVKTQEESLFLAFPFSGASAQIYTFFKNFLPGNIDLKAIQYPGRGHLIDEPLLYSTKDLVDFFLEEIRITIRSYKKIWIYGHSLGALIAYETLSKIHKLGDSISHCTLNVGACPPPGYTLNKTMPVLHTLNDSEFWKVINKHSPSHFLENPILRELLGPVLKADFTIYETYPNQSKKTVLPIPILAFGGKTDPGVHLKHLKNWKQFTSKRFQYIEVNGDHFFLESNAEFITKKILFSNSIPS